MLPGRHAVAKQGNTAAGEHIVEEVPKGSAAMLSLAEDGGEVMLPGVDAADEAFDELSLDDGSLRNSADGQKHMSSAVFCNPLWLSFEVPL